VTSDPSDFDAAAGFRSVPGAPAGEAAAGRSQQQLRDLVNDYYHGLVTAESYREQRGRLLDSLGDADADADADADGWDDTTQKLERLRLDLGAEVAAGADTRSAPGMTAAPEQDVLSVPRSGRGLWLVAAIGGLVIAALGYWIAIAWFS
jgi:hypothetical protein